MDNVATKVKLLDKHLRNIRKKSKKSVSLSRQILEYILALTAIIMPSFSVGCRLAFSSFKMRDLVSDIHDTMVLQFTFNSCIQLFNAWY